MFPTNEFPKSKEEENLILRRIEQIILLPAIGFSSALLSMVGQRRNLLKYIKNKNQDRYLNLIKKLGLRR